MPSTYTLNNGIELIGTGEQSGTWGDTTNTNLSLIDTALDGQVTVTLAAAGSSGSPNTLPISDGAASNGRNRMVIFDDGGDLGATAYVQLTPNDAEKIIYVRNALSGSRSIILFQGTYNASNDYEVPAGTTAVVYFDGAGTGAVAANVFNNAHFDALNVAGTASIASLVATTADINGGTADDVTIGGTTPADGTFANLTANTSATVNGNITVTGTVDGRDVASDGSKLDGIEAGADVTDTANVTAAGAVMDSELTDIAAVKGLDQGVATTDSPSFAGLTVDTDTLYVDSTNNRVGIGTSSPSTKVDIKQTTDNAFSGIRIERSTTANQYSVLSSAQGTTYLAGVDLLGAGNNVLSFGNSTNGTTYTERMRIDSSGNVGIGTSSPTQKLQVSGGSFLQQQSGATNNTAPTAVTISNLTTGAHAAGLGASLLFTHVNSGGGYNGPKISSISNADPFTSNLVFYSHNYSHSEAMRIDSSGNLLLGATTALSKLTVQQGFGAAATFNRTNNDGAIAYFAKDGTTVGSIASQGSGTVFDINSLNALRLSADSDNNGAASNSQIQFYIDASEKMRIDSSGNLLVGKTVSSSASIQGVEASNSGFIMASRPDTVGYFNRQTTDGIILDFRQDNSIEGSISVSGTTVSYNGGHLSRWSRLMDGADDSNIYKGTVMSNLDQMVEWGDEDNEQLNHTEISSVEGDKNVAGVFVAWDESDEWGDYYLAMTGDMVIRIAQGVTVERGDLLMSAGDGTAKPQDDDLVRSKTIAKVISTNVSHTYPDGSYAVPCVLMAC